MMKKQKKSIRYLKVKKRPKYPKNFERDYYRVLRAVVRRLKSATNSNIPMLAYSLRQDDDSTVTDAFVQAILAELLKSMTVEEAISELELILAGVSSVVDANVISAFAEAVSVDVFLNDSSLLDTVKAEWKAQQSRLVDSIVNTYIEKLQIIVSNAVQRGTAMSEVKEEIKVLLNTTDKRAKFIARNEVGNLNGIITMRRQVDCGIGVYQWSSSHDERVRPSHAEMDGKYFYWNSDKVGEINGIKVYPAPKYHPCMDYNCRCVALPVIDLEQWNMTTAVPMGRVNVKKSKELS
jgi:SPP1 gp7 family putative phage head morphogenesis protein